MNKTLVCEIANIIANTMNSIYEHTNKELNSTLRTKILLEFSVVQNATRIASNLMLVFYAHKEI